MQLWFLPGAAVPVQTYEIDNKICKVTHVTHVTFEGRSHGAKLVVEIDAGFMQFGRGFFIDARRNFYVLREF